MLPWYIFIHHAFIIELRKLCRISHQLKHLTFRNCVLFEPPTVTATQKLCKKYWIKEWVSGVSSVKSEPTERSFNLRHSLALVWLCFNLRILEFQSVFRKVYFEEMQIVLTEAELKKYLIIDYTWWQDWPDCFTAGKKKSLNYLFVL